MAKNENLSKRVREALGHLSHVEEKIMFRGVAFMVDGKLCMSVGDNEIMCRIDPGLHEELIARHGCRTMEMKGKVLKGYVLVDEEAIKTKEQLNFWVNLCVDFNKRAKASKNKKSKGRSARL